MFPICDRVLPSIWSYDILTLADDWKADNRELNFPDSTTIWRKGFFPTSAKNLFSRLLLLGLEQCSFFYCHLLSILNFNNHQTSIFTTDHESTLASVNNLQLLMLTISVHLIIIIIINNFNINSHQWWSGLGTSLIIDPIAVLTHH